jgi:hypothetical protein
MLENFDHELMDLAQLSEISDGEQDEVWQGAITQCAKRLRQVGYVESAHFMDVAALILKEKQRH